MIVTYLDSSALGRFCVGEGELGPVEAAMSGMPISSVLTQVEVLAAIHARFHRGEMGAPEHGRLIEMAAEVLGPLGLIGLSSKIRDEAVATASRTLVRSLDAIHVATAVVAERQQRRRGNTFVFCTGDQRQASAAEAALGQSKVVLLPPL